MTEAIQKARDAMDAARKKIATSVAGKACNGQEIAYAMAAKALADLDPSFTLPRAKYRRT